MSRQSAIDEKPEDVILHLTKKSVPRLKRRWQFWRRWAPVMAVADNVDAPELVKLKPGEMVFLRNVDGADMFAQNAQFIRRLRVLLLPNDGGGLQWPTQ